MINVYIMSEERIRADATQPVKVSEALQVRINNRLRDYVPRETPGKYPWVRLEPILSTLEMAGGPISMKDLAAQYGEGCFPSTFVGKLRTFCRIKGYNLKKVRQGYLLERQPESS